MYLCVSVLILLSWMDKAASGALPPVAPSTNVTPDSIATIIYTSGTTGNPKGVELSHRNIISDMQGANDMWDKSGVLAQQVTLAYLPWAHIFGMTCELHQFTATGTYSRYCRYPRNCALRRVKLG